MCLKMYGKKSNGYAAHNWSFDKKSGHANKRTTKNTSIDEFQVSKFLILSLLVTIATPMFQPENLSGFGWVGLDTYVCSM